MPSLWFDKLTTNGIGNADFCKADYCKEVLARRRGFASQEGRGLRKTMNRAALIRHDAVPEQESRLVELLTATPVIC